MADQHGRRPPARRPSPVAVRSISYPKPGWTLQEDAVRLAEQGYQLDQVQRVTGYAPAHVRSHLPESTRRA